MTQRDFFTRLMYARANPLIGRIAYLLLKWHGTEIPRNVCIGAGVTLEHGGAGVVIHSSSVIGDRVKIYPGVTLGRADVHRSIHDSAFQSIEIGDDVVLSTGAKVLCSEGVLTVGRGSVVGANAVLLESTGANEMWGGIPARKLGMRDAPMKEKN